MMPREVIEESQAPFALPPPCLLFPVVQLLLLLWLLRSRQGTSSGLGTPRQWLPKVHTLCQNIALPFQSMWSQGLQTPPAGKEMLWVRNAQAFARMGGEALISKQASRWVNPTAFWLCFQSVCLATEPQFLWKKGWGELGGGRTLSLISDRAIQK